MGEQSLGLLYVDTLIRDGARSMGDAMLPVSDVGMASDVSCDSSASKGLAVLHQF